MSIPDYQSIMLPLLKTVGDEREHSLAETVSSLANGFNLSVEERHELLPSGQQPIFHNRVGWARTYLKKAGLIESTRRGYFRITDRGLNVLKQNPERIDVKFLDQFEGFKEFRTYKKSVQGKNKKFADEEAVTPEEALANAYENLKNELAQELSLQVKAVSPEHFENIVVDLLVAMGYGGSRKEAARAIGRSGDEGIDGIINEDRLGLDVIYIQAKRWEGCVGRPEIQKFAGALQGQHAKKGVFITTSTFSKEAIDFSKRVDSKIILIDGEALVEYMIEHNIGVNLATKYEAKKIDYDYFIDD
jgi:restriction system protein